ncbi:cytochrome P450 [Mycena rosella]|uniref:Cytochrome P450 n=1 Tax=Mycena rosella TaxID=1033263 RepID=A0AAD7GPC1_MYCRO|nr:cytochrome P450 [Mycena rosella]
MIHDRVLMLPRSRRISRYNGISHVVSRFAPVPYPTGPPGLPLIGNIFDNPGTYKHRTYKAWGPVICFRLLTEDVIVLNTREMSWNRGIALCRAGKRHRTYRKLFNGTLSASASKALWGVQEKAAHNFAGQLFAEPDYRFLDILRRSLGLNVVGKIFGSEPAQDAVGMTEEDMETYIDQADQVHALFTQALAPFAYMVDWIPILKYVPEFVPFATFKRDARRARESLEELTMFPYLKSRSRIKSGSSQKSYLDFCFASNPDPTPAEEDAIAWTAMSAYTGGSDTTIAMVTTLFLAAALHPTAQALAQLEIDKVIGQNRMPTFEDKPSLPYVNAFVQECLRPAPAVPVGVAYRAMESDTIDGYYIAEGTTIIANIWRMLHDENIYKDPSIFAPSRFLPRTGTPTNPRIVGRCEPDIISFPFGFGRRVCPAFNIRAKENEVYDANLATRWEEFQFSDGAIM